MQIEKVKTKARKERKYAQAHLGFTQNKQRVEKNFSQQQKFGEGAKELWLMALRKFRKDNILK